MFYIRSQGHTWGHSVMIEVTGKMPIEMAAGSELSTGPPPHA